MKSINILLLILSIFCSQNAVLAERAPLIVSEAEVEEVEEVEEADETEETEQVEEAEKPEEAEEAEEAEEKVKKPSPEEIVRLKKLAAADKLYREGDKIAADKLYREAKPAWEVEKSARKGEQLPEPFYDPAKLSPGGKVYWRNYQQGKKQQLESKIFASLELITQKYPEFIPGHVHYARILKEYEREEESLQVLDRIANRYPNEPKVLKVKMDANIVEEKWLEASITARQFALFNPNHPEAKEFTRLSEEYLEKYKSQLRSKITWNAIGNAIAGTLGFVLTGNLFGPISAVETTAMLLRGESAIGESTANKVRKQFPLTKNKEISNYVERIGNKVAKAAGRDEFEYEFYVLIDEQINAFALPGGKVFVNIGAITNTDTEAELAGLLAHEVAHAALSHGFQLVTQGNLTANVISYIPYVGGTASNLIVMNYSRDMEKQADIFGTRILVASGYAADGVRNLMAKLDEYYREKDLSSPPAWLSTHPESKQRIRYMENLIVNNNFNRYAYEGVEKHQQIKSLATKLWQEHKECIGEDEEDLYSLEKAKECADKANQGEKTEEDTVEEKNTEGETDN